VSEGGFVNKLFILLLLAGGLLVPVVSFGQDPSGETRSSIDATQVVEKMRPFSMQLSATVPSDGRVDPTQQRRIEIIKNLRQLGKDALPALTRVLSDSGIQMRRNAALAMIYLAGGYIAEAQPRLDIREAMPALIQATADADADVRAWAAHALAEIGPGAQPAIPALIRLLSDKEEGPRNTSCLALGKIGPAAKEALPALREALQDSSRDVRRFAEQAIEEIEQP
jgi:HEAT repeat protein